MGLGVKEEGNLVSRVPSSVCAFIQNLNAVSKWMGVYFTASTKLVPALNFGVFLALILIASPVAGLRPIRAERFVTEKVPKPGSVTLSPFFSVLEIASRVASRALPASALVKSDPLAMASIKSPLFIISLLMLNNN